MQCHHKQIVYPDLESTRRRADTLQMRLRTQWFFLLTIVLTQIGAPQIGGAQIKAPPPNYVNDEIQMLHFVGGGSPLTSAEQQQAANIVAMGMRTAPDRWKQADASIRQSLAIISRQDELINRRMREVDRNIYVFQIPDQGGLGPEFMLEKKIIDAHDPVLFEDAARQRVLTRHMLPMLEQASAWVAKSYQLPPPGPQFEANVLASLKAQYLKLAEPVADGLMHIESNGLYAPMYFDHVPPAVHAKFFSDKRSFNNLDDPTSEQWELAETAGMLARYAAKQLPAANGSMQGGMLSQQMQMKALQGAARSFSPSCNVTVGSYSSRAQSGCYP